MLIVLCLFVSYSGLAQKNLIFNGSKVTDNRIYITLNGTEIEYFTSKKSEDSKIKIIPDQKFSVMDGNSCNIYMRWLNPLKYMITWKDSVFIDDRDKAVTDFIGLLASQFGTSVTLLNKDKNMADMKKTLPEAIKSNKIINGLDKGFNSLDLTLLFVQLNQNIDILTEMELNTINELVPLLTSLDSANSKKIAEELDAAFISLYSETDPVEAKSKADKCKKNISVYEKYFQVNIENQRKRVLEKLEEVKINNALLNSLTRLSLDKFLSEVNNNLVTNRALVAKLSTVIEIIDESVADQSQNPVTTDYYRIKGLSFDSGEKFETSISISEYKYNSESKEFIREREIVTRKMMFEGYDLFAVTVSAGICYSNTTLKGFGVSAGVAGDFTVTEDDITKSNPVTALFLNFNLGIGSRYLSPLAQIGIDPTKKRPFLLLGGGFSIPVKGFALTGGLIWTWDPALNDLSVGETVYSTTALDKDISYEFDVQPKGWYLGVQYNF